MQTILLDTHVLIWMIEDDPRLGTRSRQTVTENSQPLAASYFSLLEATIKSSVKKLKISGEQMAKYLQELNIQIVWPDGAELRHYKIFSATNKDPFDNLLIATVLENDYAFMTADHKILDASVHGLTMLNAGT